jgi:tRNA U34 5-methylaminomethyl-2-thiouridine-forming methyltransferase MnmC
MERIITKDGSETFYSLEYGESYHSISGAVEESFKKYIEASPYEELARSGAVKVLDICFGLGYNSAAAIERISKLNPGCKIILVGLEKDPEIMNKILSVNPGIGGYELVQEAIRRGYSHDDGRVKVTVMLGDARDSLRSIDTKFDLVFHDPFSPKKNPELWTEDFFKELIRHMKKGAVLTTYSCARLVRENLKKAGFSVKDGPCVGRRAPSTIATAE